MWHFLTDNVFKSTTLAKVNRDLKRINIISLLKKNMYRVSGEPGNQLWGLGSQKTHYPEHCKFANELKKLLLNDELDCTDCKIKQIESKAQPKEYSFLEPH